MPLLGAHMSIAGGCWKAVEAAAAFGMETVQLFTKNNNQWRGKPLTEEDVRLFRKALEDTGVQQPCGHNSYLINVASPNEAAWTRSRDALLDELQRADRLGLDGLVMHPGAHLEATPEQGLELVIRALDDIHRDSPGCRTQLWLEVTAGQGSCLGWRFEHLAAILDGVEAPERLGVCVDTCHLFAAGYDLRTPEAYVATMDELDRVISVDRVRAFHLNDSKNGLASRVDRHEHIGEGSLGLEPFRLLLNDPRFADRPMYLETKKEPRGGEEMDAVNLRTLRGLLGAPRSAGPRRTASGEASPGTSATEAPKRPAESPRTRRSASRSAPTDRGSKGAAARKSKRA